MAFPNTQQHRAWCQSQISHVWGHLPQPGATGQAQRAVGWQQATRRHATSIAMGTIPCRAARGTMVPICAQMCGGQRPCWDKSPHLGTPKRPGSFQVPCQQGSRTVGSVGLAGGTPLSGGLRGTGWVRPVRLALLRANAAEALFCLQLEQYNVTHFPNAQTNGVHRFLKYR